jgi:hypothetical protein
MPSKSKVNLTNLVSKEVGTNPRDRSIVLGGLASSSRKLRPKIAKIYCGDCVGQFCGQYGKKSGTLFLGDTVGEKM